MVSATVTSKGQITIPAKVRQALQVESGDRVEFVEVGSGRFEVVAATQSVTEIKRMFGKVAKRVSIEDMNKAIMARGAAARRSAWRPMCWCPGSRIAAAHEDCCCRSR